MNAPVKHIGSLVTFLLFLGCASDVLLAESAGGKGQSLLTRWARDISRESVLPEYPRPQLVRQDWMNLNGEWELAIADFTAKPPASFPDRILVPFPLESELGGARKTLSPLQRAWYRREFTVDSEWESKELLLHFGAVDWHAEVWINGIHIGEHQGGYDPFYFDITDAINFGSQNVIIVGVVDPTDAGTQPRGKQIRSPEGIWYTPISGIWQTVWIEPVPVSYIAKLQTTPNLTDSTLQVVTTLQDASPNANLKITAKTGDTIVSSTQTAAGEAALLKINKVRSWSPDDPFLYDLEVELIEGDKTVDRVKSYFGMRSVELGKDQNGQTRILLNDEPLFQFGPLDQGYWPDGLYTAPSDAALKYDLEVTKRLGFNMVRKHVKVEPARWYYWCDRLGLLVWQDMPNGDKNAPWPADGVEVQRSEESEDQFRDELRAIVNALRNSPSIVVWVPFNEAWGQFNTESVTEWLQDYDPTRLIVSASGGNDFGCGHINDDHFYPGPGGPPAERDRASVLGEFGGLGLPIRGHTWQQEQNWGYRSFHTQEQLTSAYESVIAKLRPLVESHLSAAVYTQTTDVEIEVNGLMTYDREIIKANETSVRAANASLFNPLPIQSESQQVAASVLAWWRFENGNPGKSVSDLGNRMGAIAAHDFSGHNNHLYAFSSDNAPSISTEVPQRPLGLIKETNTLCLDDSAPAGGTALTRDLYSNPDISRTHMDAIDRFPFNCWTIEASFCLSQLTGEQVVIAKEQNRSGEMYPLFQIGVFGAKPTIGVQLIDESGESIVIRSDISAQARKWYHVAVTCNDGSVKLYVAVDEETQDYELVGTAQIKGSMARHGGTWLVGRGCDSGKMGRDFLGWVDEIRISTKALKTSQFVFGKAL